MKKITFLLTALLVSITSFAAALGSGYEKVTNISNLTTGDKVVVYCDANSYGVTGWNNNKDATVAATGWVEYLVEVGSGGVYLKDEGANKYIASPGSSNQFKYGTKAICTVDANGVLKCNNRFLVVNGSYYRMYASIGSYKPFYVYKVVASEGGDDTEDLADALKWSAATATVQMGADDNEYPTLTNDKNVDVTYSSSSTTVATIDANGEVTLVKEGTTTISAYYEGGEIEGVTYAAKNVSYTLTVKPAPLVIEPIDGGIIDILTHDCLAATSSSYANFSGKQAKNDNHSDAVYAGRSARNGNATQYSIQLNTIDKGRIATTTTGGLAKRVYVKWSTQATINTNARELYIYGSNTAFTGSESTAPSTKIGTIKYTTGAAEAYVDLTGDYKYILITGSGAIYMDEIHVTWVSAAGTVVTPTISGEAEFVESTEVSIATEDGYKVYYTLDGTEPTNASTEYTAPFTVNATTTVKAVAYDGATASDVVSTTLKALEILTCEAAAEKCAATESTDKYVVRGYVTSIPYPYSASNTAPTFWMADTKDGGNVMQAYKVTPVNDADKAVAVGDQVQVIGKIKLYNSTPEVNGGTYTITVPNPKYNVNITSAHGTVTATPASAVEGAEVALSVEVESGWVFQSWTVTDASSNPIEVVDNKFTMPASDVTVVANYTESVAPDAVLKLSANGIVTSNTYKVGETVKLPETIVNECVKMFVGWSVDANCAIEPEYAPGADFTLTAEEHTLYAVYASGTTGETVTIKHNSTATTNMTGNNDANKFFGLDAAAWSIVAAKGGNGNNVGINKDGTIRLYYAATGGNTLTVTAPSKVATIKLTYNGTYTNAWVKVNGNKVTPTDGVYTIDAETFVIGNANTENVQVHIKNIAVTLAGALADFSTTCSGALAAPTFSVAEGTYNTAQSITLSAAEGTIYYTLDGSTPTSASTQYSTPIVLDECGEFTIKAIAIGSESESPVASATYTLALPIPANDAENPYTGTEAIEVYNGGCYDGTTLVYVTGTVQTAEYSSSYGNYEITFADGFQCYRLQKTATEKFTEDVIGAGDVIVACGKLDKYGSKYQLAQGCYLVKHTPSVKADAELAWNPETVTLTVGDAFAAPTLSNPYSVVGITYKSSNDDVATVNAEGVIALVDDAVGTATITATFAGDATYKPATVTCTIQVKPVQEDCEGSDDFETATATNASSYNTRTTEAGWKATNAAKTTIEGYTYLIINGKTSAVGTITSPVLNGGIGSIKIRYANTYGEDNGVSFRLDIKQGDAVVKTYTITKAKAEVVQNTVYTELIEEINVEGDFVMVFTNLSPSKSTSNKDRVSIGRLCWTGYVAPILVTPSVEKGIFSVGNGKFVQFSTGNLQYKVETNTWSFAENQYDYVGEANINVGNPNYEGKIDMFGWSNGAANNFGVNPSNDNKDYIGTFQDWGNLVNEEDWYTLSADDWKYLLSTRANASSLKQIAKVDTILGIMLFPDNWTLPADCEPVNTLNHDPEDGENTKYDFYTQNYTLEQWTKLEEAGAVFLPAAGRRTGGWGNTTISPHMVGVIGLDSDGHYKYHDNTNYYAYYWTSTYRESDKTATYLHNIKFLGNNDATVGQASFANEQGRYGQSVRLVKAIEPGYKREVRQGYYGTICLKNGGQMIGASRFELSYYNEAQGLLYMDEADATMVAGNPYIFLPNEGADSLYVFYDETTATEAGTVNGLVGSYTKVELPVDATTPNYILKDNKISKVVGGNVFVGANKAYIQLGSVKKDEPAPVPGRRRVAIGQAPQVATGMESVDASAQPVKMIINGQLFILRGEKMYDAQGKLVK